MNTLSLGPDTVCVEASETPVMELSDQHGFDIVPVAFYDVSPFGAGQNCCKVDVYWVGAMEEYFPN